MQRWLYHKSGYFFKPSLNCHDLPLYTSSEFQGCKNKGETIMKFQLMLSGILYMDWGCLKVFMRTESSRFYLAHQDVRWDGTMNPVSLVYCYFFLRLYLFNGFVMIKMTKKWFQIFHHIQECLVHLVFIPWNLVPIRDKGSHFKFVLNSTLSISDIHHFAAKINEGAEIVT